MTVAFITLTLITSFLSLASSVILDNEDTYLEFSKSEFSEFSKSNNFKFSEFSKFSEISKTNSKFTFISDFIFTFISDSDIIVTSVYDNKDTPKTLKIASATSIIYSAITYTLLTINLIT